MNLTTQQSTHSLIVNFQQLSPNEIPSFEYALRQSFVLALKGIKQLLLIYPINIILLLLITYWIVYSFISKLNKPNINVYWPNKHIQAHDQHIKNLKKDIREVQNQSLNLNRRMQAKKEEHPEKIIQNKFEKNSEISSLAQELVDLIGQRQQIKETSQIFIHEIKATETKILQKLRKYRR